MHSNTRGISGIESRSIVRNEFNNLAGCLLKVVRANSTAR